MFRLDHVLFVIAHIIDWKEASRTHLEFCNVHECLWITTLEPPDEVDIQRVIHINADQTCDLNHYHTSTFLHI